jgi:hypothetical protein
VLSPKTSNPKDPPSYESPSSVEVSGNPNLPRPTVERLNMKSSKDSLDKTVKSKIKSTLF